MKTTLLLLFSSLFLTVNEALGQGKGETYSLGELAVTLPEGYSGNSRMIEGNRHTAFRKDGSSAMSQLVISVADTSGEEWGGSLTDDDLWDIKDILMLTFKQSGHEFGPATAYQYKTHKGFKAEGTYSILGMTSKVVFKCTLFSHYMVVFLEYYGEDYSSDYHAIEESLRLAQEQKLSGMQTISNGGFSFVYDADKLLASTKSKDNIQTFTFSCKDPRHGDCFLELSFFTKSTENLYGDAIFWFDTMKDIYSKTYANLEMKPLEKTTFLGKSGYMHVGTGNQKLTDYNIKLTMKVCNYNGYFTTEIVQQTLNEKKQASKEVEELFKAVEASLRYSDSQ